MRVSICGCHGQRLSALTSIHHNEWGCSLGIAAMYTKDPLHECVDSELAVVVVIDVGVVCVGDNKDIRLCVNLQVRILAFIVYHLPTNG